MSELTDKSKEEDLNRHLQVMTSRIERIFALRDSMANNKIGEEEIQGALLATMSACVTLLAAAGATGPTPDWERLLGENQAE